MEIIQQRMSKHGDCLVEYYLIPDRLRYCFHICYTMFLPSCVGACSLDVMKFLHYVEWKTCAICFIPYDGLPVKYLPLVSLYNLINWILLLDLSQNICGVPWISDESYRFQRVSFGQIKQYWFNQYHLHNNVSGCH